MPRGNRPKAYFLKTTPKGMMKKVKSLFENGPERGIERNMPKVYFLKQGPKAC
jgi:hypothetical protein